MENQKSKMIEGTLRWLQGSWQYFPYVCFIIYRFVTYYLVYLNYFVYYVYDIIEQDKYSHRNCYLHG